LSLEKLQRYNHQKEPNPQFVMFSSRRYHLEEPPWRTLKHRRLLSKKFAVKEINLCMGVAVIYIFKDFFFLFHTASYKPF
jgi:hypothetical protein